VVYLFLIYFKKWKTEKRLDFSSVKLAQWSCSIQLGEEVADDDVGSFIVN
jgi:hypothetical protein